MRLLGTPSTIRRKHKKAKFSLCPWWVYNIVCTVAIMWANLVCLQQLVYVCFLSLDLCMLNKINYFRNQIVLLNLLGSCGICYNDHQALWRSNFGIILGPIFLRTSTKTNEAFFSGFSQPLRYFLFTCFKSSVSSIALEGWLSKEGGSYSCNGSGTNVRGKRY